MNNREEYRDRFQTGLERWENEGGDFSGPIRTRGMTRKRGPERQILFKDLIAELQAEVNGFPLAIVVHDWGTISTKKFLSVLSPLLRKDDTIWYVWYIGTSQNISNNEIGIILNMENDTDKRLYNNLMGDIVFFPAEHINEMEIIKKWKRRARIFVINGNGPLAKDIAQAIEPESAYTLVNFELDTTEVH